MNLLLDIGNSRIKWGMEQDGAIREQASLSYREAALSEQLRRVWRTLPTPKLVAIACVAGPERRQLVLEAVNALWPGAQVLTPKASATAFGVSNAYQQPEKLGIDRWLALLAAHRHYPGYACIADCGTAITLDVIDSGGRHLGGLICPGLRLMKDVLVAGIPALNADQPAAEAGLLAGDTAEGIAGGTRLAAVGVIEAMMIRLPRPCRLILCGGDAVEITGHLQQPCLIDADLVFKGLSLYCATEEKP